MDSLTRLVETVRRNKERTSRASKQRRGGVTDLYSIDYVGFINNSPTSSQSSGGSHSANVDVGNVQSSEEGIIAFTKLAKALEPGATVNGIAGAVGYFMQESKMKSTTYEADYVIKHPLDDKIKYRPTAEELMGSWGAFQGLYPYALTESVYNVGGQHYIGIGLGQSTGTRAKALVDYTLGKGKPWWDFKTQVEYFFDEPGDSAILRAVLKSNDSVDNTTKEMLYKWGRTALGTLPQRVQYAKEALPIIQKAFEQKGALITENSGGGSKKNRDRARRERKAAERLLATKEGRNKKLPRVRAVPAPSAPPVIDRVDSDYSSSSTPKEIEKDENGAEKGLQVAGGKGAQTSFRILIPGDLDRFQRWFFKIIVEANNYKDTTASVQPLSDVHITVHATNSTNGRTADIDLTHMLRRDFPCNYIGDDSDGEGIFPDNKPTNGYDLMYLAWYMDENECSALFSPGEKVFTIYAVGEAKVTFRNFLKYSHIN